MNKLQKFEPVFVKGELPYKEKLEHGKLYISREFSCATYLCPCGCCNQIHIAFNKYLWNIIDKDGKVTIRPSILSDNLPCKSHYFITENHIDWV